MPKGDDQEVVGITRKEWNELMSKIDDIYTRLFGNEGLGVDGMYEEHKLMWDYYKEEKWWKNKATAIISTLGGLLGIISTIIAIILGILKF